MEIYDLWGKIVIDNKFKEIVNSREFKNLKLKNQLGLTKDSSHTRYDHSIGVFHLAKKLVDLCKKRFSHIIDITIEDEEAILLMALVHDIGHGAYSHVAERVLEGSHEERTVAILIDENSHIHSAIVNNFSYDILEKVVDLIKSQKSIKNNDKKANNAGLAFILGKLLSGGIDIDRLDYISRDSKELLHEENDYISILEAIDIECINDSLEIVFDGSAEYAISNFFNKRFEMYDNHYLKKDTIALERIFRSYIQYKNYDIKWTTNQIELENEFLKDLNSSDPIISRYAKLLHYKEIDASVLVQEFSDALDFVNFKNKLISFVPETSLLAEAVLEETRTINIYSPKNKIYMRKNGIITDISECSKILNSELCKVKQVYSIDLELAAIILSNKGYSTEQIKNILRKILKCYEPEIEQEKKYEFISDASSDEIAETIFKIKEKLNLVNSKNDNNEDKYYDDDNHTLGFNSINLRKRVVNGIEEFTLKRKIEDSSSNTKRREIPFTSLENAISYIKLNYELPLKEIKETVGINTKREKYLIELYGGSYEFVFDLSSYSLNGEEKGNFIMIECEHKSGSTVGLYFINQLLQEFNVLFESRNSKLDIAKKNLENSYVKTRK